MITIKQESALITKIKSLSEIEFTQLMEVVAEHVRKNKWDHITESTFDSHDLRSEVDALEEEVQDLAEEKDELTDKIFNALTILDDMVSLDDDFQKDIEKIKDILR